MAFYNDAPGRKPQKKNHAAGSWADEGSNYTGARRFGPRKDDERGDRPYGKREDRPYGERKSYGRDDRRDNGRFEKRDFRRDDRRDFHKGDRKDFRRDDRRDFKPAEPKPASSYRDAEYRPVAPAPSALEVMETMQQENLLAGRNPIREALRMAPLPSTRSFSLLLLSIRIFLS